MFVNILFTDIISECNNECNICDLSLFFFSLKKMKFCHGVTFIFRCDLIAGKYGTLKLPINKTDVRNVFVGVDEDNSYSSLTSLQSFEISV